MPVISNLIYGNNQNTANSPIPVYSKSLSTGQIDYIYFDMNQRGYSRMTLEYYALLQTMTIQGLVLLSPPGQVYSSTPTTTDGTGATIVDTTLVTSQFFGSDNDLIGCQIQITSDSTSQSNVNQIREITGYTAASGTCFLDSVFPGATTAGVTQYKLIDGKTEFKRRKSDPSSSFWRDITSELIKFSNIVTTSPIANGIINIDDPIGYNRIRIRTENAIGAPGSLTFFCNRFA